MKNFKLEEIARLYAEYSFMYLYGAAGVGKTVTIKQFQNALKEKSEDVIYIDMAEMDSENKVKDGLKNIKGTLIIDSFQDMQNKELLKKLAYYMEHRHEIKIIFVSRIEPPAEFIQTIYKNNMKLIDGQWFFFDKKYIYSKAAERKIILNTEQLDELYGLSKGWPAIVELLLCIMEQDSSSRAISQIADNPMLINYIEHNIWGYFTEKQKSTLKELAVFPYITCAIADKINYWEIKNLADLCVLKGDEKKGYELPGFLIHYMSYKNIISVHKNELLNNAGDWLKNNGLIIEALECYFKSKNKTKHRECMYEVYKTICWEISNKLLKEYVMFSMQNDETAEALFLKGMININEGQFAETEKNISVLKHFFYLEKGDKRKKGVAYLNMLYYYPNVSITEWLDEAMDIVKIIGNIYVYSINCTIPGCLCAGKDLSELFCHKKKEIENYKAKWDMVFEEYQRDFFELAKIEYLTEINRTEEAFELLKPFISMNTELEFDKRALVWGLLVNTFIRGGEITGYHEFVEECYKSLMSCNKIYLEQNIASWKIYYDIWKKKNVTFSKIIYKNESEDFSIIGSDNYFYLFNKAKIYMFMKKYEKAYMLFERLYEYFSERRKYYILAECGMGQAVAAYAMGDETKALKLLTMVMSVAKSYRYIGSLSLYGDFGKNLVIKYCDTIPEWNESRRYTSNRKKTYYYGNVIGVSLENYLKVLIRVVRKNAARYPFEKMHNVHDYEMLTMTEVSVLQYIEQGYSNNQIAEMMNIKMTTVKKHVYNIYKKLEVNSRVQAVQKGKSLGILVK